MESSKNLSLSLFNHDITNTNFKCPFINQILIRYIGTFIFFIGIISTLLSICVFTRKPLRRKSCCFYFLILAISDSIHLTTMTIEHLPYSFHIDLLIIHSIICKLTIFMIYFSNHLSNIVLTLASIDRFILIYYPSQSKRFCRTHKARRIVLIIILILIIFNGHILYGFQRISVDSNEFYQSLSCHIHHQNIFYINFFHFYDSYIESICFVLIPFILMSLCSILIIIQIIGSRRTIRYTNRHIKKTRLRDKDIQLCCMLIGTSFAFLILCLPAEINDIINYLSHERSCLQWFRKVILMLLQQIYYAGHFYIYTLTGQIFRKHLNGILFKQRRKISMSKQRKSSDIQRSRKEYHERMSRAFFLNNEPSQEHFHDSQLVFSH